MIDILQMVGDIQELIKAIQGTTTDQKCKNGVEKPFMF